ncbi:MAG: hypothetical protein K6E33_09870 [Lachnospiraceae bacterium]|nr:hypothetical protein [Lachnospiraceae bacterium]
MGKYDYYIALQELATNNGYKLTSVKAARRKNNQGSYSFVTACFVVPDSDEKEPKSAEAQKEVTNEIQDNSRSF